MIGKLPPSQTSTDPFTLLFAGAVVTPQTEHHSLEKGDAWDTLLTDDVDLCGEKFFRSPSVAEDIG
jgi:hypothetical protein